MKLKIEISEEFIIEKFINAGIMYNYDERWVTIEFNPAELTSDERQWLIDNCYYDGYGVFFDEKNYLPNDNMSVKQYIQSNL